MIIFFFKCVVSGDMVQIELTPNRVLQFHLMMLFCDVVEWHYIVFYVKIYMFLIDLMLKMFYNAVEANTFFMLPSVRQSQK